MTYFISPWLLIMKIPIQICVGKFDSERVLRRQFLHKPDQQIWKKIKNPIIEISSLTSLCINHDQSTHKRSPFALPYAYPIVLQYSVTYAACCYAIVQHIVLFYTQTRVSLGEAFMVMHLGNPLKYPIIYGWIIQRMDNIGQKLSCVFSPQWTTFWRFTYTYT